MVAKSEIRFIPWDKCSERGQEMVDKPDVRALQIDRDGFVAQTFRDWDPSADVSTDLL